jgi:hypothetical protein
MGRLAFAIALFYTYHMLKFGSSRLLYPLVGLKTLTLIFFGAMLSFSLYAVETSFTEQLHLNAIHNSLRIYNFIRAPGFFLMFILFFSFYKNFLFFIKTFIYGASVIMLLVLCRLDEAVVSLFGTVKEPGQIEKLESGFEYLRRSFVTMDNNTYGGILAGLVLISLYLLFTQKSKSQRLFCLFFLILSSYSILITAGRANSLKLTAGIFVFVLLSTKVVLKQHRKPLFLLVTTMFVFMQIVTQSLAYRVLVQRWDEVIYNLNNYDVITNLSTGVYHDNYIHRILAAIASMPQTFFEWVFGTGGIQSGYVSFSSSASHIELANWLSQYGLITFIPFIGYQLILFNYFLRYRLNVKSHPRRGTRLYLLRNLGLSLLIGLWLEMLISLLFFGKWVWLGIITCIAMLIKREKDSTLGQGPAATPENPL